MHGTADMPSVVLVTVIIACCLVRLQVLNLAGNRLRSLPSDIGWLSLKQLNISDNPDLSIPPHVLQKGFK